jgi:hypothetical protein
MQQIKIIAVKETPIPSGMAKNRPTKIPFRRKQVEDISTLSVSISGNASTTPWSTSLPE